MALSIMGRNLPSIASLATVGVVVAVIGWVMQDYHMLYKDTGEALGALNELSQFTGGDSTIYAKIALYGTYLFYLVPIGAAMLLVRLLMRAARGGSKRGFTWNIIFVLLILPPILGFLALLTVTGGDFGAAWEMISNEFSIGVVGDYFLDLIQPMGHKLMLGGAALTFVSSIIDLTATSNDG